MKESIILKKIMLACSVGASRLFRNNLGVLQDKDGNYVRYGVGNPGGADLIGWKRHLITFDDVGKQVAIFAAIEVKKPGEKPTLHQVRFLSMVEKAGGIAGVATSQQEAVNLLGVDSV